MANIRQYIGARYVVKIYENSQDPSSAEWEQGNFEPLVMVTWQNGSYLSKKEVPASVGNPASNPNYWVQTGFYNGQIAALQSAVDTINNNIGTISDLETTATNIVGAINEILHTSSSIANRRFIFIGDSYAAGTLPSSWYTSIVSYLGLTDNTNSVLAAQDGAGFVNGQFLSLLQGVTVTDADKITDIVVVGGLNDDQQTESDILTAISAFATYAKTTYKNAKISLAFVGWRKNVSQNIMTLHGVAVYKKAVQYGIHVLNGTQWALHRYDLFDNDYPNHPNSTGNEFIARAVANAILTGSYDPTSERQELSVTWNVTPTAQSTSTTHVYDQISEGCGELHIDSYSGRSLAFTIPADQTIRTDAPLLLFTLPANTHFKGFSSEFRTVTSYLYDNTNGVSHTIKIGILDNSVFILPHGANIAMLAANTYSIPCESFVAPLGDC